MKQVTKLCIFIAIILISFLACLILLLSESFLINRIDTIESFSPSLIESTEENLESDSSEYLPSRIPKFLRKVHEEEQLEGKELYISYIAEIVEQYYSNVDPYIVLAVMETESNFKPDVQSRAGAVGLMQVIPKYHLRRAEKYGLTDIWDPYTNIICGIDLLDELYSRRGDWYSALLGYNNSSKYANYIVYRADELRGGNYFGEKTSQNTGGS